MKFITVSINNSRGRRTWLHVLREEVAPLQPRYLLARLLLGVLPDFAGGRLRASVLRWSGFHIGPGVVMCDVPRLIGPSAFSKKLVIGAHTFVNADCLIDLSDAVFIGKNVSLGPQVMLLTSTHEVATSHRRAGELKLGAVRVGDGAWLGARALILPGVIVGEGAVVAAGALVTKDVQPNTLVAGVPAKVIRRLDKNQHASFKEQPQEKG